MFVVLDDADIDEAVRRGRPGSATAVRCTAAKRFILHEKIADRFMAKFSAALQSATPGDPLDEKPRWGRCRHRMHVTGW